MKKNINFYILAVLLISILGIRNVYAASGSYSISSNSSVNVGDTFSVTFRISAKKLYYWQSYITYDNSKLQLVSGSTVFQGSAAGKNGGISGTSKTVKFKAKKTGKASISIAPGEGDMNLNFDAEKINYSKKTKAITISEKKNVTYSSNNNLKSLSIEGYKLNKDFSKDTKEYSVELPNDIKEIKINATAEDKTATISGDGKIKVKEGSNKIAIKVTAENGNTKEYIINATVKELEPIEVEINNEKYTVIRKRDDLPEVSSGYVVTTTKIGNDEVPALTSEITKYTLVALKNSKGETKLYIYNEEKNTYTEYSEYTFNKVTIIPIEDTSLKIPSGYKKSNITFNDNIITGYKKSGYYPIFIGMNVETGEKHIYSYDSIEKTVQIFNSRTNSSNKVSSILNFSDNIYTITIIALGGILVVTYTGILISLINKKKKPKRISIETANNESSE